MVGGRTLTAKEAKYLADTFLKDEYPNLLNKIYLEIEKSAKNGRYTTIVVDKALARWGYEISSLLEYSGYDVEYIFSEQHIVINW